MKPTEPMEQADLLRNSHLAASQSEIPFTEFELALHHITEAFSRWSVELNNYVGGAALPVQDVSVLQVVRMRDRPKSAAEIGKYLNREDAANVLYGLRKLEKCGLIEKSGSAPRLITYQITELGRKVTDRYATVRRDILLNLIGSLSNPTQVLEDVTKRMWLLAGFYEQAARTVTVMSCLPGNDPVTSGPGRDTDRRDAKRTRDLAATQAPSGAQPTRRGSRKIARG